MDDRRTACPLTDAELDRAIRDELAVDPSPAFLARVRTHVANEPRPNAWRMPLTAWMAGGAVFAAAAMIAVLAGHRPNAVTPRLDTSLAARQIGGWMSSLPTAAPAGEAESFVRRTRLAKAVPPGVSEPALRADEPFTVRPLIDARESQALRALIFGVGSGGVDLSPTLKPAALEPADPPPIADIEIEPIAIDPIAPFDGAQGVRQ